MHVKKKINNPNWQVYFSPNLSAGELGMAPKLYVMYPSPPCRAAIMVAKAINLELEIEEVEKEQLKTPEMLELNPQHTVPILVDDDFVIWDSHAIAGYLVGAYAEEDTMYPKEDIKKRALIDQRLHFDNGILYERCKEAATPLFMGESEIPEEMRDKLLEAFGFLEIFLKDTQYFAGDELTIADLCILGTICTVEQFVRIDEDRFPQLTAWLKNMKELPYYEEVNANGLETFKSLMPNVPEPLEC